MKYLKYVIMPKNQKHGFRRSHYPTKNKGIEPNQDIEISLMQVGNQKIIS